MISIIVPIYNVENYVNKCIESIINQTHKNIEIILVDDGSPDNCASICDQYAKEDSRVNVVHQENKGLIEARKSGLRAATGDYVCFVDGDDWIEEDMYEHIASQIEKYSPDCVITQFYYSYPDKEEKSSYCFDKEFYSREELENEVFPIMLFNGSYYSFGVYPNCWTKVFKRELLEKHLYSVDSRIRMGEDIAFTYPCLMECQSVAFVDKALYHYRINYSSMTKSYDKTLKEIFLIPYDSLVRASSELGVDLSEQLPYYLLYLINFLIRNEVMGNGKDTNGIIKGIFDNHCLMENLSKINIQLLPKHTRILYQALIKKNYTLIKLYMKLLRRVV